MIACFDVSYDGEAATAAAITFRDWTDSTYVDYFVVRSQNESEYEAGSFYKRELAPLMKVLESIPYVIETCVIDAYCHLSEDGTAGLGVHLHKGLEDSPVIIGVAKNRFRGTTHAVELKRGGSIRPLFVTSIGIDYSDAAECIESMAGSHRIPKLLKLVDSLCRTGDIMLC